MADTGEELVAVTIKAARLTSDALLKAINNALTNKKNHKKTNGRQTWGSLVKDGSKLQNIEVSDKNIRSFEESAKKFGIDYAVKKVPDESPPKYIVFFKGKDTEQVNRAFKDYVKRLTNEQEKPSVIKKIRAIQKQQEQERRERSHEREHKKERGMQR